MVPLFVGLTAFNLLGLGLATALGYAPRTIAADWHPLVGSLAALVCCAVHCVVFTYFAATAKWVQHAIAVKKLDPRLAEPTRSFKAQAFPAAMLAMAVVLLAAFTGAAADVRYLASAWHHVIAWLAIGVNLLAAIVEYRAIVRNGLLIDGILARIAALESKMKPA